MCLNSTDAAFKSQLKDKRDGATCGEKRGENEDEIIAVTTDHLHDASGIPPDAQGLLTELFSANGVLRKGSLLAPPLDRHRGSVNFEKSCSSNSAALVKYL